MNTGVLSKRLNFLKTKAIDTLAADIEALSNTLVSAKIYPKGWESS